MCVNDNLPIESLGDNVPDESPGFERADVRCLSLDYFINQSLENPNAPTVLMLSACDADAARISEGYMDDVTWMRWLHAPSNRLRRRTVSGCGGAGATGAGQLSQYDTSGRRLMLTPLTIAGIVLVVLGIIAIIGINYELNRLIEDEFREGDDL